MGLAALIVLWSTPSAFGITWKTSAQIGSMHLEAELDDDHDPVSVRVQVENQSGRESVHVTRSFVALVDAEQQPLRSVPADEIVSDRLKTLRTLLPQYAQDVDLILGEIRADYPQEKIVSVYGKLKAYMSQGRPVNFRAQVENWITGKRGSQPNEVRQADALIEEIGLLGKDYFWPNDIPPLGIYRGVVYFERPAHWPPSVYFQVGDRFLGVKLAPVSAATAGPGH